MMKVARKRNADGAGATLVSVSNDRRAPDLRNDRRGSMPELHRPKILYITHRVPYPPDKGDRIRNFHILTWLARRASVHLACLADESVDDGKIRTLESLVDRVGVVPHRSWLRWARAVRSLATGRTITEGVFSSPALRDLVRAWAKETQYHATLASASGVAPYLRLPELEGVPAVVDFVDVDSQKWFDYAQACRGPRAWLYRVEGRRLRRLEHDAAAWARATVLVSEAETNLFRQSCNAPNVYTVTNGVDLERFAPDGATVETGQTCVFVGALDYRPNIDGVCWFCRDVWPEIYRQRPGARLLLVGRQPVPAVRRLATIAGVELVGQVPDVRPFLAGAGLVLVPLRLARGVQNKVLEALAMGKATVASPQSLVGLQARGNVPVLTASTPTEWVESVIRLMDDPALRRRLGCDGRLYVEQSHCWDRSLEPLGSILGLGRVPDLNATPRLGDQDEKVRSTVDLRRIIGGAESTLSIID
jgi:polysaccharide biosynthesis protein PslH